MSNENQNEDEQPREAIILLVDDDPGDQELTRRALADDIIKTQLRVVSDGEEAMAYLERCLEQRDEDEESSRDAEYPWPDLILLDLNMPRMDGKQVLEWLRSEPRLDSIPVIILTTSKQEEDILRSYELGCNSFVSKPVEIARFIEVVREIGAYWFQLVALPRKVA